MKTNAELEVDINQVTSDWSVRGPFHESELPFYALLNGEWVGQGAYNDSDHLDDDEHWQDEHHEFINLIHHPVTHWQPLPAAPKGV